MIRLVPPRGFEPLVSTLKGWRPRPLDDGGLGAPTGQAVGSPIAVGPPAGSSKDKPRGVPAR